MADERYITEDPELDDGQTADEDGEGAGLYEHFAVVADKGQAPLRLHTGRRAPLVSYANGVSCSASRSRAARASTRSSSSCWVCTPSLW